MSVVRVVTLCTVFLGLGITTLSADQPPLAGGDFAVSRTTLDTGGGVSAGGAFQVRGTIGQADTGKGGANAFVARTGYWSTPGILPDLMFKDEFEIAALRFFPPDWVAGISLRPLTPLGPDQYVSRRS